MAKVITIMAILIAIFGVFSFLGIANTNTSHLLTALSFNDPGAVKSNLLWSLLFSTSGALALFGAGSALIIGIFTRQSLPEILLVGFTSTLAGWIVGDLLVILNIGNDVSPEFNFISSAVKLIVYILIGISIVAVVQWWRGADA